MTTLFINRASIAVNSLSSSSTWFEPSPPKNLSTKANTKGPSSTSRDEPFNGSILNTFWLDEGLMERQNSSNSTASTDEVLTSTTDPVAAVRLALRRSTNLSLITLKTAILSCEGRALEVKSYVSSSLPVSGVSVSVLTFPLLIPPRRESTSSWDRTFPILQPIAPQIR